MYDNLYDDLWMNLFKDKAISLDEVNLALLRKGRVFLENYLPLTCGVYCPVANDE